MIIHLFLFTHCLLIFCIGYFSFCTWLSPCLIFPYFYVVHFHISLMSLFKITTQLSSHKFLLFARLSLHEQKILPKVAWTLIFWCIPYWFIYYPKKIQGLIFDFTFFSCFGCWCTSYGSIHGWWMFVGHAWCWKPRLHHEGVHALRWLCQSLCWKAQLARYDIKFQSSARLASNRKYDFRKKF